jgi:tRNA threonylcarbamoyladenosine biosynthesis protein TsaB
LGESGRRDFEGDEGPLTLAVETATETRSVALVCGRRVLASRSGELRGGGASRLLADIDEVLKEAGLSARAVELFAATQGPGSFTGLRTGLATLLGLAVTLEKPLAGVPTLHAVAFAAGPSERTVATIPAGRGEVFAQLLGVSAVGRVEEHERARHVSPARLASEVARLGGGFKWAGPGLRKHLELLRETASGAGLSLKEEARAGAVADDSWSIAPEPGALAPSVALLALAAHGQGLPSAAGELRAIYVRPSDAELNEQWHAQGK